MSGMVKKTSTYAGIALWAFGCSSSGSTSSAGGQLMPGDAGEVCDQPGAGACDGMLTAMCTRFTGCCASLASCEAWATDMARCKAHWVETGLNCASPKYSSRMVCASLTTECQNDVPLIACT